MKKIIAFIVAFVALAAAPSAWILKRLADDQKLDDEIRQYRKVQADHDIKELNYLLAAALESPSVNATSYMHTSRMQHQMEILNRMYQRI